MAPSLIAPMASSLMQPAASSLINPLTGKRVIRAGNRKEGGFLRLLALPFKMKVLRKGVKLAGRRYHNIDHMDKHFYTHSVF